MSNETRIPICHPSNLGELFDKAGLELPRSADRSIALSEFTDDSRRAGPGAAFIAVRGETVDGHRYIPDALNKGVAVVIAESAPPELTDPRILIVPDTHRALPRLAHAWWGAPSNGVPVVAVTGTNGKTTIAYLTEAILREAGLRPAVFTTVEYRFEDRVEAAPNTTPGAAQIARLMAEFRSMGANAFAMEASSHALAQGRVQAIHIDVALLTNLTQDHLDYHHSMEEYALAKKLLFTAHHPAWSVFNLDDQTASRFNAELPNRKLGYALDSARGADICATELEMSADGIRMRVQFPPDSRREAGDAPARSLFLQSPLRGRFNASNLLAACAVGFALGLEPEVIVEALRKAKGAPGRFEAVHAGQPFAVYVDYAHTPDAVERLLLSARQITPNRLIAVLGCGGDRDATKRPLMGAALGRLADFSVITNDNPRTEDPASIAKQMEAGIKRETGPEAYAVVLDRGAAIRLAIEKARPGDTVVIAGKGHEDYQIIGDKKTHFDDREEALRLIRERFPEEKDKT